MKAASILAARKLADWDGGAASPKHIATIAGSVKIAERIMARIDSEWPEKPKAESWRGMTGKGSAALTA
jgi:hypothetical protein